MSTWSGELAEGERIGVYRVVRRIGGGGMGVVFEAHDEALRRRVALKVIAAHLAEDVDFRGRFIREAQALASLDSDHVVRVYAYGEDRGRLYLVTQLIPDGDLERLVDTRAPLTVEDALEVVAQVAAGLADAHASGLIHRDIKPANVLLRRRADGLHAYLSDFGIARDVGAEHTRTAGAVGTPSYMAPELHTGTPAGVASDVYSLGCLLWATLSGRAPYGGTSDYQIVTAHLEQPVPQLAGTGPAVTEVNRILRTALAKDPANRYPSAAQLRDDLRRARRVAETGGSAVASSGRRPLVLLLVVLLLGGGTAYVVSHGGDVDSVVADSTPPTDLTTGAVEAATASLAQALGDQGVMSEAQARCTADRWIAKAGLQAMQDAGFFDGDWNYVDQDRVAMTPGIEAAASTAATACAILG